MIAGSSGPKLGFGGRLRSGIARRQRKMAYLRHRKVIVTHHNAHNTLAASRRIIETTVSNIEAFGRAEPRNFLTDGS